MALDELLDRSTLPEASVDVERAWKEVRGRHRSRSRRYVAGSAVVITIVVGVAAAVASSRSGEDLGTNVAADGIGQRAAGALAPSCQPFEDVASRIARRGYDAEDAVPLRSRPMSLGAFHDAISPPPETEGPILREIPLCVFIVKGTRPGGRQATLIIATPTDGKSRPDNFFATFVYGSDEPEWWLKVVPKSQDRPTSSTARPTIPGAHCLKGFDALEPAVEARYVGLPVSEAEDIAATSGTRLRVIAVNGKCDTFLDDRSNRIDAVVIDGIVRAVAFG